MGRENLAPSAVSGLQTLAPFRLSPEFHTRIWGYQDLAPWFQAKASGEPIGEVWLTGDGCLAETGPLAGKPLKQITTELGSTLLGAEHAGEDFPLLVKVLFPKEKLSVQVHPDDAMAQKYGDPRGKTECWYSLESAAGARVALGLKPGVTKDQVRRAIRDTTLEDLLEYVPMSAGDMVYVDAGTVHAILPGSVILETQQNCDLTYRLYDYGRPRELHLERSLEAMRSSTRAGKVPPRVEGNHITLIDETYFRVDDFKFENEAGLKDLVMDRRGQLQILFVAKGSVTIAGQSFEPFLLGQCQIAVIPASAEAWTLECPGKVEVIRMIAQAGRSA
jgi:mannose-6-phosphate isomerase